MEINVLATPVVPEMPRVIDNEQIHVYAPTASGSGDEGRPGIASYSSYFEVEDGKVTLSDYAFDHALNERKFENLEVDTGDTVTEGQIIPAINYIWSNTVPVAQKIIDDGEANISSMRDEAQQAADSASTSEEKAQQYSRSCESAAASASEYASSAHVHADASKEAAADAINAANVVLDVAQSAYHEMRGEILKNMYGSEDGAILYIPDKQYAYNLSSDVTKHNSDLLRAMFFRDVQVNQINGHTFNGCSKLSYIDKFPNTLYDIHGSCFAYCGFSSIEIDCVNLQNRAFRNNPNLTKVVISDRVQKIFEFAFFECRKLDYVKIGSGVKSIGTGAFKNCMTDGSWQPVTIDMTAFTHGIALPTLQDWDSFPSTVVIKVVRGRKAELETMTNWNAWASAMIEVDTPDVDSDKIINFYLDWQGYTAESGMTWGEWLNSKYNVYGYTARFNSMTNSDTVCVRDNGDGSFICIGMMSVPVAVTDTIGAGFGYISEWVSE